MAHTASQACSVAKPADGNTGLTLNNSHSDAAESSASKKDSIGQLVSSAEKSRSWVTTAEDIRAERAAALGIVWAEVLGHPFWPAQIIPSETGVKLCGLPESTADDTALQVFGTGSLHWLPNRSVVSWADGIDRRLHYKAMKRKYFTGVLEEVLTVVSNEVYPSSWWCVTSPSNTCGNKDSVRKLRCAGVAGDNEDLASGDSARHSAEERASARELQPQQKRRAKALSEEDYSPKRSRTFANGSEAATSSTPSQPSAIPVHQAPKPGALAAALRKAPRKPSSVQTRPTVAGDGKCGACAACLDSVQDLASLPPAIPPDLCEWGRSFLASTVSASAGGRYQNSEAKEANARKPFSKPSNKQPQQPAEADARAPSEGAASQAVVEVSKERAYGWVQCEHTTCGKWRRIPSAVANALEESGAAWYCEQNDDVQHASCTVAQELPNEEIDRQIAEDEENRCNVVVEYKTPDDCVGESTMEDEVSRSTEGIAMVSRTLEDSPWQDFLNKLSLPIAEKVNAGHAGAQLTSLGNQAIGWKLEVFWPLDSAWYTATVEGYDCHKWLMDVRYEDDAVEKLRLYELENLIRNAVPPET
ncbi:hypothetical protein CYMTET_14911 [Cymbomonas tetramitiformis]|uniref:CW-type domain-containing protein n=1 Tax=Cymbomonas tetramitiformis TaxID=36881 RepID=A0AAE0GFJ9_9CHLO|nr:hypothetical protein CYMTET_14911 [Cymbomonas tetramitiformis]|eukprot:gene19910-23819_t